MPGASGTCNLTAMLEDAPILGEGTPEEFYSGRMTNAGRLDWEFFGVDPNSNTVPATTDLYNNLYNFGSVESFSTPVNAANKAMPPMPTPSEILPPPPPQNPILSIGKDLGRIFGSPQVAGLVLIAVAAYYLGKNG